MKIDFSKEEYRALVEVFSLSGMVLDAYGRGQVPEKKKFYELEQKIYASCDDFGSGDMIRRDPQSNELARKWKEKTPERMVRIYDQFVDDAFLTEAAHDPFIGPHPELPLPGLKVGLDLNRPRTSLGIMLGMVDAEGTKGLIGRGIAPWETINS